MKHSFSFLLILCLAVQVFMPAYSLAGDSNGRTQPKAESRIVSDNLIYSELDYELWGLTVIGYKKAPEGELVIPTEVDGMPVGGIGENAFKGCKKITSVYAPSIYIVLINAFQNCTSLKSVYMPYVHTLQKNAFRGCSALENAEVYLVNIIDQYAFWGCSSMKSITLYDLEKISRKAFFECSSLEAAIMLCDQPAVIDQYIFDDCAENFAIYYVRGAVWNQEDWKYPLVCIDAEKGDVNLDDKVNTADAVCILQYCAGVLWLPDAQLELAHELTPGYYVSTRAATVLLQYCAGIIPEL